MRRSKLETCLYILEILNGRGPLKITHIMQKANLNFNALKGQLGFLIRQGMIEERVVEKQKLVYAITPQGMNLRRLFINRNRAIPTLEANIKIPSIKAKKDTLQD